MPKIIPAAQRNPTFAQRLNLGVGRGLEMGQQMMKEHEQKQQLAKENELVKENFGIDLSGITDTDTRRAMIVESLKGKKGLTPLQLSQKALADERLKSLQSNQKLFGSVFDQSQENDQMENQESGQISPENKEFLSKIPEEKLMQISSFAGQPGQEGTLGNIAAQELKRRKDLEKTTQQKFESERAYHTQFSKEQEKEVETIAASLPKKEMALDLARNSVETGDLEFLSPDKLADATGIDAFRTGKGAQLITASKENLLSNLSKVSAKAQNIWFEQRLNSMFPKIGQSKEANLTVQEMLEAETAMDKSYVNEFEKLSKDDFDKYGFVKKDISKRARRAVEPKNKEIMRRSSYRMKEIEEQEKGLSKIKNDVGKNVVKGTPLTLTMAKLYKNKFGDKALDVAEKNGYYIPTLEELKIYQQRPEEFRQSVKE